ncbi:hypothetical protein [Desulfosporosinus sp. BG]|uniref:hypothetical protein n=1 Tax=Desulfosporosinus sp. BG TaxID=1633135 RepID=UPI000839FFB2|nr:hypothetical protein [Desulfosporosinus sp. BG]ODA40375.1 hypothetical protein DSBG_2797 [Desulfosporosinus sp. BG]
MAIKLSEKVHQMIPAELMESINHEFYDQSCMDRELIILEAESFEIEGKMRTEFLGYIAYESGKPICYVVIAWESGDVNKLLYTQRISDRYFQEFKRLTKGVKSQWAV